jgi:tripartite-type tricarboxylate transporter receptor subunit TctC
MIRRILCAASLAGLVLTLGAAAKANEVEDFYKGKQISLVVSSASGGGYDTLSRIVAKHIGRFIPGNPVIVVRNMPGAGGIVAINYLYNAAPKDGATFGQLQNTLPFEPVFGNKEAQYDSTKFNWLGSASDETGVLVVRKDAPIETWQDLLKTEITVGAPAINSTPGFNTRLLSETLGLKLKLVVGYRGQNDVFLAMDRGEVDAFPTFWSSLVSTRPDWIRDKTVKMIVQYGPRRELAMTNVPFAADLVTDPAKRQLLRTAAAPLALGRPFALPPDVAPAYVAAMRKALAATFGDADYRSEAERIGVPANAPATGEQLQKVIEDVWNMPDTTRAQLLKINGQ